MSEDATRVTAAMLTRVIKDCSANAEIGIVLGKVPLVIPVESISITQNGNGEELIAFNLDIEKVHAIIDGGIKILEGSNE